MTKRPAPPRKYPRVQVDEPCKRGHVGTVYRVLRPDRSENASYIRCTTCDAESQRRRNAGEPGIREAERISIQAGQPGSWSWWERGYMDDPHARTLVRENPGGMTLIAIGVCFGVTRERIRQIEAKALAKFRRNLRLMGGGAALEEQFTEMLRLRASNENAWKETG